jgi:hypothetical protein
MLVVLASRDEPTVGNVVADWGEQASILTCRDLSTSGWRHYPHGDVGTAVIGGWPVRVDEIDGVLVRLPGVAESELEHIDAGDRRYVATEMNSFLSAWLSGLPCPVLNRPTAESLMGPYWQTERWVLAAAKLGIPVVTARRSVPAALDDGSSHLHGASTVVNVIGHSCVGDGDESARRWAIALAAEAGVGLLRATFATTDGGVAFLAADYWVDIYDPEVADAIVAYFAGRH